MSPIDLVACLPVNMVAVSPLLLFVLKQTIFRFKLVDFSTYLSSVAASTGHICNRVPRLSSCDRDWLSFRRVSNSWCLLVSLSMSSGGQLHKGVDNKLTTELLFFR